MKLRGTRGGIILSLSASDTLEALEPALEEHRDLFSGSVFLEVAERVSWRLVQAICGRIEESGGRVAELRPPTTVTQPRGETVIVSRTIRSGGRVESTGSVVVLGDVNSGAEIVAEDDIIVVGSLRGLAHAGAGGNENAVIWAQQILAPQLRIGGALAQSGDDGQGGGGPEVAHLQGGQIVLRPWDR